MTIRIALLQLEDWVAPSKWPVQREFCVLVVAERTSQNPGGYASLICSAILNDTSSIYFWGPESSSAADAAVFAIAAREEVHKHRMRNENVVAVPFPKETADEAFELIVNSWMPNSVVSPENSLLVVCGLRETRSMGEVLLLLRRSLDWIMICPIDG